MINKNITCKLLIKNAKALGVTRKETITRKAFETKLFAVVVISVATVIGAVSISFLIDAVKAFFKND